MCGYRDVTAQTGSLPIWPREAEVAVPALETVQANAKLIDEHEVTTGGSGQRMKASVKPLNRTRLSVSFVISSCKT